jgi:hypothetical protein
LLIGETQQDLDKGKDGFIGGSGDAYKKMYPKVADALLAGEKVTIKYSNINLKEDKLSNASPPEMINASEVNNRLSDIKGLLIDLNAKLEGKNIV